MKTFLIVFSILFTVVLVIMGFVKKSVNDSETHEYEVLQKFEDFEIRKYGPALYSSVKYSTSSFKEISSEGFRTLAGYIFGGNERNEQIAMTSPVSMEISDSSKMMFLVPKSISKDDLPKPNNANIYFEEYPERIVAAINFGGWASDEKIDQYTQKLIELLASQNITHSGKFAYLGYNPPFDVVNRRNEIVVDINWTEKR